MGTPPRPNPIPTMLGLLLKNQAVVDLCADRILGGKVAPAIADLMPIDAVVLTRAGGFTDSPYVPMHSYRIQATCYGGGAGPGTIDEVQAALVSSAVADALTDLNNVYDGTTVIKSITLIGGPTQTKDVDMNNVPAEVLFFRVYMPTLQLVAPY